MISVGTSIQQKDDKLQKVGVDYIYNSLRNPKPWIEAMLRQLQVVREVDAKQYSSLKRQLPYLVCAMFNPPVRRTENFAFTEYFIVDIDHIGEKGLGMQSLRENLQKDSRVMLLFASPSHDGLKVLFRLTERCYDSGLYSTFYKAFLHKFSMQYHLEQVVDTKTSDVTRACFVSIDKDAYYNPFADTVTLTDYVDTSNPLEALALSSKLEKQAAEAQKEVAKEEPREKDPDADIMNLIKQQLKEKRATMQKEEIPVYVPEQLDELMSGLVQFIDDHDITLVEVKNIQYAKKMSFKLGLKRAEINLFYGKHGFKVVQSPKSGTSAELNAVVAELIEYYIADNT